MEKRKIQAYSEQVHVKRLRKKNLHLSSLMQQDSLPRKPLFKPV